MTEEVTAMERIEAVAIAEHERQCANALRMLAVDAVEKAGSGHPGMPMGMAEIAMSLWTRHLRHNPLNPRWPDRDRFVLSNGHGSMLLYGLLHLTGYDLPMREIERFRQLHSRTPGHPELGVTAGVETTTGPLGQGLANAVGMALAEQVLSRRFNRFGYPVVDHHTWVFVGDGCLMEGISHEACSIAGTLRLAKLIAIYDSNGISIDGEVGKWFTDDTAARFRAYRWHVIDGVDGHDLHQVDRALSLARESDRPTLVICQTTIGKGSPGKAGTAEAHGAPLGAAEVAATRAALGWSSRPFEIPDAIRKSFDARERGRSLESEWQGLFDKYREAHPAVAIEFERVMRGDLPDGFHGAIADHLEEVRQKPEKLATRQASQRTLTVVAKVLPEIFGGSADLTHSNLTSWPEARPVGPDSGGNYLSWGVREFAMTAGLNGMALHGGIVPFGGTFLVFSDYARNAVRMSALMRQRVIHIYTHDSIGLGEDGPTHQPIEHLASLRLIPNLEVWRPCDAYETAVAWREAILRKDGPSVLALSRQALPAVLRDNSACSGVALGGYIVRMEQVSRAIILAASGSEIQVALACAQLLESEGHGARVISIPCSNRLLAQSEAYREALFAPGTPVLGIEAGHPAGLLTCLGPGATVFGIETFGESAPGPELMTRFGFAPDAIVRRATAVIAARQREEGV